MQTCDLIVIGASQGGQALALHAAQAGQRVILFERDLHESSSASSAQVMSPLLAITSLLRQLPALTDAGITAQWTLDLPRLLSYMRDHAPLPQPMVEHTNLTIIGRQASFADKNLVTDSKEQYRSPRIVIATGQAPAMPEHIQGLRETPYLTPQSLLGLTKLPARIAILGAGRTGVTLAQALATLGCQVHLLDREDRILPAMPDAIAQVLAEHLTRQGVRLHVGASVTSASHRDHRFTLRCRNDDEVITDALLLATGSVAQTQSLGCKDGAIKLNSLGQVQVNPKLETSVPGVFAIGSCTDQPKGQANAWEDAQRLMDLWQGGTRYLGDRPRVYAIHTQPQAGHVGLSPDEAELAGYRIAQARRPVVSGSDQSPDGFIELLIDKPSGKLVGATLAASDAAQTLATLSLFIALGRTWRDLLATPAIEGTLLQHVQGLARQFED